MIHFLRLGFLLRSWSSKNNNLFFLLELHQITLKYNMCVYIFLYRAIQPEKSRKNICKKTCTNNEFAFHVTQSILGTGTYMKYAYDFLVVTRIYIQLYLCKRIFYIIFFKEGDHIRWNMEHGTHSRRLVNGAGAPYGEPLTVGDFVVYIM